MDRDQWLARWLALIGEPSSGLRILELGCGTGRDTAYLTRLGYRVTAADLSDQALRACGAAAPAAARVRLDLRAPWPFQDRSFPVVVASLCLHYFEWDRTLDAVGESHRCLCDDGVLLTRLNSTRDVHYGAVGHTEISPHFYQVDARQKRFFDRASIDDLFGDGWIRRSVDERVIDRYEQPKVVWELVLTKCTQTVGPGC